MFITALFTIARTWKQPRRLSADEWIRKLWYIYTMECYSAIKKNIFESILMRWMKLEPFIQSEVSQKEKQYINTYIWNLERWEQWLYMRDIKRDTDIKNRLLDSVREGEGGMIWENSILHVIHNIYITICEIDHQSKFDAWNRALKANALGQPWGMGWGGR